MKERLVPPPTCIPVKFEPSPENDDAVTIPEKVAPPYTFKVAPAPTFISEVVVTPEIIKPFETVGAPVASLSVIKFTRNLPALEPPPNVPLFANPKTSGIKSSPSAIIKSALSLT